VAGNNDNQTVNLIFSGVGGQGVLLATELICGAALQAGMDVKKSEIHGMAQRGGVVESAIVFGDATSSIISDGEADILLGFEPAETLRAINRCSKKTMVITNTATLPPFTVGIGKGNYPDVAEITTLLKAKTAGLVSLDAMKLAREAGSPMSVNIVLLGALIQTGALGFTKENVIEAIRRRTKPAFLDKNLKAFELGMKSATTN
jgi:indolepyruvate ferredoxin oxidoreductase beta subunit